MTYIKVGSKNLYIEEYGKGNNRAIVIFHGGPGKSCRGFENQATALSEKYHVICFDQCGASRSDAIFEDEPFGMTEHIHQIDKMREILGISSWTVMGHSYGGTLACLYAYTYPQSTDAVIYVGACWDYGMAARAGVIHVMPYFHKINSEEGFKKCLEFINSNFETRKEAHDFFRTSIVPLVKDYREICFFHKSEEEIKNIPTRHFNSPPNPEDAVQKDYIHRQKIREGGEIYNDFYPYLNKTDKESLFIFGKYEPICVKEQDCYLKNAPKGRIVEFNNSGHFPYIEEPQKFTETIIDFMDNLV